VLSGIKKKILKTTCALVLKWLGIIYIGLYLIQTVKKKLQLHTILKNCFKDNNNNKKNYKLNEQH